MGNLTRHDYAAALDLLAELEQATGRKNLLDLVLARLPGFIACERAELAVGAWQAAGCFALHMPLGDCAGAMAVVLLRRRSAFTQRDRARLALLSPHVARLHARCGDDTASESVPPAAPAAPAVPAVPLNRHAMRDDGRLLTARETDVMHWVSFGKTDADVAALLAISKRTVHKHLEHIYEKLGVETRTAAVMALDRRLRADVAQARRAHPHAEPG